METLSWFFLNCVVWPAMVSTTAPGSVGTDLPGAPGASRRFISRATNTAKRTPKTAITRRALRCQRATVSGTCALQVRQGQLHVGIPIVVVLLERERDVERGLV